MTFGFSHVLFTYLLVACLFCFLIGIVSTSYLASSMLDERMRDIGVIKASGCPTNRLFTYFMTEIAVVILSSCLIGTFASVLLYRAWSGRPLVRLNPLDLSLSPVEILIIISVPIAFFLTSYFVGSRHAEKAIQMSAVEAISSQLSSLNLKRIGEPILIKRFGWIIKLADRNVWRDKGFMHTIACLSVCIFLTTSIFIGGFVSADTTRSYLERATPRQVLIIGEREICDQYVQLAESFSTVNMVPSFDYLSKRYVINPLLAGRLREIPGVEKVDTRLITMTTVKGGVEAHVSEGQLYGTLDLGSSESLIIGIDPSHKIGEWMTTNGFLEENSQNTAIAGDSHLADIVHPSLKFCKVEIFGKMYDVAGICVDSLNQGRFLFIPLKSMQEMLGDHGCNIILVKVNNDEATVSKVKKMAQECGLVVTNYDKILDTNLAFLDHVWSYVLVLPAFTLVSTSVIFFSYLAASNSRRFKDYIILRAIGAENHSILRLLLCEASLTLVTCVMFALPASLFFCTFLLIRDAKILFDRLLLSTILSPSLLFGACIANSVLYSKRVKLAELKDVGL